ncbi:MFS transporter [Arthrobacter sedimenti]|uniref:MFS transporter n=1 Tax=Arthrobacter sedimenti TaxID=2694931 RepID=UPI00141FDAA7|nr:MFS transporter [Arthrobacter sedimenti]
MKKTASKAARAMSPELRPLIIGILAIITCAAFEAMAVVTAMPSVARELSGESSYGLAFSMYLTASLLGTVVAGSWCDRKGPRPALAVGLSLMILGLLAAGAAPDFWLVTVGRAVSGLGGGFMIVAFAAQWAVVRLADTESPGAATVSALVLLAAAGIVVVLIVLPALLPKGTLVLARGLPSIIATRGIVNVAFFGVEAFIPLMLVSSRGIDPGTAGLTLSAAALGWSAGSFVQARVTFGRQWLLVAGSSVLSLSLGGFVLATAVEAPLWVLVVAWGVSGSAMGMALSSASVLVLKLSAESEQGRNSAALQISDQLGGVVGTAGAGALFALLHDPSNPGHVPTFVAIWLALWVFTAAGIVSGLRGARFSDAGPGLTPSKSMEGTVPA